MGRAVVIRGLLIVEDRALAENHVPVAELWRDENLQSIAVGEREALPLPELWRGRIIIQDGQIELAVQTRDELPRFLVAVNPSEHVLTRGGDVVLYERAGDSGLLVELLVVSLNISAPEILEYRRRLDEQDAIEFRSGHFHGS